MTWIHGASVTDFWLLVAVLMVICLVCLVQGFLYLIRKRTIEAHIPGSIRGAGLRRT